MRGKSLCEWGEGQCVREGFSVCVGLTGGRVSVLGGEGIGSVWSVGCHCVGEKGRD